MRCHCPLTPCAATVLSHHALQLSSHTLRCSCITRRETLEQWALSEEFQLSKVKALEEASQRAADEQAKGNTLAAEKYRRRHSLMSAANMCIAVFGPAPPDRTASEEEILEHLVQMDAQQQQPGAAGVWDAQWVAEKLCEVGERSSSI